MPARRHVDGVIKKMTRRRFVCASASAIGSSFLLPGALGAPIGTANRVMTVRGPIPSNELGLTLTHEHVLVDFIGAAGITPGRYDKEDAFQRMLPFLKEIKELGCKTLVECTPAYLGRDPQLLQRLSVHSGMHLVTNTGYYGAANNKFLPAQAYEETAAQLAKRWIAEWEKGIDGSGVRPGFIKIGVGGDELSPLHAKLVAAAAQTHLATGLAIASHTGPARLALEQLKLLKSHGVKPRAFIWVHAQSEKNLEKVMSVAGEGCWVSFDGFSEKDTKRYIEVFEEFESKRKLDQLLISHDAGWFKPGEPNGGDVRPFTPIFRTLIPELKKRGLGAEMDQVFVTNPAKALAQATAT